MALEAIKALFGGLPGEAGPLGGSPPPEDLAKAARTRQRAWAFVSSQVSMLFGLWGGCVLLMLLAGHALAEEHVSEMQILHNLAECLVG